VTAAIYEGGRRVRVGESRPVAPKVGEVRLRVSHCGVCGSDIHIFLGDLDRRAVPPRIIGHETSGVIEEVGEGVDGWQTGDPVTVLPVLSCGECPTCLSGNEHVCPRVQVLGVDQTGGMQTSWTVPAAKLFRLPAGMPLAHGALIEPLAVACHDVLLAKLTPGEKALVIGGGPIGALVALVARHEGADVVVAEVNPFRVELMRSMGLTVVNPKDTAIERFIADWSGDGVDVVFEVSGTQPGADLMTAALRPKGRVVLVSVYGFRPQVDLYRFFARELSLIGVRLYNARDFERAIELAASGALPLTSVITATEPIGKIQSVFEDLVAGGNSMKVLVECS
jgi:(R,R)-butanediol dehydrogenase/meso-butanediol dehydrogenase/diacetyl reductase